MLWVLGNIFVLRCEWVAPWLSGRLIVWLHKIEWICVSHSSLFWMCFCIFVGFFSEFMLLRVNFCSKVWATSPSVGWWLRVSKKWMSLFLYFENLFIFLSFFCHLVWAASLSTGWAVIESLHKIERSMANGWNSCQT